MSARHIQTIDDRWIFLLKLLLLAGLLLLSSSLVAQRPAALVRKGDQALAAQDYYTAIHYFQQAIERKSAPDIQFRLAQAALAFKAYDLAIENYQQVLAGSAASQYPVAHLSLAQALQAQGEYAAAIAASDDFQQTARGSKQQNNTATALRSSCQWALAQEQAEEWDIVRLGRRINSPYSEFGPWKSGDTLYFTSYRYEKKDDRYTPVRKVSKVLTTTDEQRGRVLGRGFNQDTILTAHTAINRAGSLLFFTRCRYMDGAQISCRLCVRRKDRRRRWAKTYTELPSPLNMANYTSTQPAIMWDSVSQTEYLLFASDRPGGSGGFDLWQVPIPVDIKQWESPIAMTAINSPAAEMTPHFSAIEQVLYFSTNRSPGFGGFDLGKVNYLGNDNWGVYSNLGPAINSSYDDNYPFFSSPEQAYFSSNRPGGRYLDEESKSCCSDLFKAKQIIPDPDTQVEDHSTDVVVQEEETPETPEPTEPRTLEEFLPLTLYYDNDQPDPRTRRSTTQLSYEESYFNYLAREDDYYDQFEEQADIQDELASFFEQDVAKGFRHLERFSAILLEQLEAEQTVEIFLKGYTSPRAQGEYNLLLGKRRVSAVRNHFDDWKGGIFSPYIESGKLIISEVSFGETKAGAAAKDEKAGERLSIYSPEAARERRVEIVEIKRG